ncbi:hypothetical protein AM592_01600 [Bacillus gobiensis]|uniref:Uncharacterized protein n=1 Tax=Bacillus gobiensis TaxID=1441095 RepID=A0A0M3R8X0_9BACI|nr:hypothetical protein AM592_01600 [Bacillus gobiensis]
MNPLTKDKALLLSQFFIHLEIVMVLKGEITSLRLLGGSINDIGKLVKAFRMRRITTPLYEINCEVVDLICPKLSGLN